MGHVVRVPGWHAKILPSSRALILEATSPIAQTDLADRAFQAAQVALDALSVGGGAYSIPHPRDGRLLWWSDEDGKHLRMSIEPPMRIPGGILTADANRKTTAEERGPGKPHDALRYFRMAQLAGDAFSAFHLMYLAFERLLSERVEFRPPGTANKRETEAEWIRRALDDVVPTYARPPKPDERPEFWKRFHEGVYEDVRCRLAHSKKGKAFLLPSRPEDVAKVQKALQLVTEHVLELASPILGFAPTVRPLMDHELAAAGGYIGKPPRVALLVEELDGKERQVGWIDTQRMKDRDEPGVAQFAASLQLEQDFPPGLYVTGLGIDGAMFPQEVTFAVKFPLDGVRHLEIDVAHNFRMDQNIRTIYIHKG